MGQAQQKRGAVLIVEDDADLRSLTAALFEDGELDTIECESAEAALATMLIRGRDVAMTFADVRLRGVMDWFSPPDTTRVRPRTAARGRLHPQALAAAQRADRRRRGACVCALTFLRRKLSGDEVRQAAFFAETPE